MRLFMRNYPNTIKFSVIFAFIAVLVVAAALFDNNLAQKKHTAPAAAWLGVQVLPIDRTVEENFNLVYKRGLLVQNVIPGSPAGEAGIIEGDIIRRTGSMQLLNTGQLKTYIRNKLPGQKIRIVYIRGEITMTTYATLELSPISGPDTNLVHGIYPFP